MMKWEERGFVVYPMMTIFGIVGCFIRLGLSLCNSPFGNIHVGYEYDFVFYVLLVTSITLYYFVSRKPMPRISQSIIIGIGAGFGLTTLGVTILNNCTIPSNS